MIYKEEIETKTGHALFSPSQLSRILACPASAQEATRAPVQTSSPYAQHGTMLHDIIANVLLSDGVPSGYPPFNKLEVVDQNHVLDCFDYVQVLYKQMADDYSVDIEKSIKLDSWGLDEIWGTADVRIQSDRDLHVIDWKFGSGVQVFAQNNEQSLAYAAGAVGFPSSIERVHIHIVQPPLNHFDEWVVSYDELKEWVFGVLEPGIQEANTKEPAHHPGEKQCRFCPASMQCKARDDSAMKSAQTIFQTYSDMPIVTPAQLTKTLHAINEVMQYAKEIQLFCHAELMKGREVPGFKLVSGRSLRKWKDIEDAEAWLAGNSSVPDDLMFTKKFISPAQAEKMDRQLKKEDDFKALITKPDGKPQLASDEDSRPAIHPNDSVFKDFKG